MQELTDFECRVLEALASRDQEGNTLLAQLSSARVTSRDHTGMGVYTKLFVHEDAPKLARAAHRIQEIPKLHLYHPSLPAGAGMILWLSDGVMSTLECYTYEGVWPENEAAFIIEDVQPHIVVP